jgi:hypothetical protein
MYFNEQFSLFIGDVPRPETDEPPVTGAIVHEHIGALFLLQERLHQVEEVAGGQRHASALHARQVRGKRGFFVGV